MCGQSTIHQLTFIPYLSLPGHTCCDQGANQYLKGRLGRFDKPKKSAEIQRRTPFRSSLRKSDSICKTRHISHIMGSTTHLHFSMQQKDYSQPGTSHLHSSYLKLPGWWPWPWLAKQFSTRNTVPWSTSWTRWSETEPLPWLRQTWMETLMGRPAPEWLTLSQVQCLRNTDESIHSPSGFIRNTCLLGAQALPNTLEPGAG